jgi:hypothetical protein
VRVGDVDIVPVLDAVGTLPLDESARMVVRRRPGRTALGRRPLLDEVLDTDTLVICGHYPGTGIGHVLRGEDARVKWQEARSA